ncbi:MAG TPA: SpoIIE family protein phosphatase [Solirubrobacteraceae bacterium]|nr:SpoIIE family protein phosphatase [Solirubrobacteraceae bacterium]
MSREPRDLVREALLEESAEDLYDNAPCGYLSTLPDGLIVKVNQTFLTWTCYAREDLVGRRRFQELLTPGGRIYHETHFAPLLHMQGAVGEIAVEVVRADGGRLPMLVNSVLRRDEAGAPLLVRTTAFDATDRKRYERELLAARDRERAARERNEQLQRVTAALAAGLDERQIAEAIVGELVAATGAVSAVLAVADEDAGPLRVVLAHGPPLDLPAAPPSEPVFDEGPRSLAALPLGVGGRSAGLLCLGFAEARRFSADERALLVACAAQCAQALERARLHERTLEAARRMALLAEAGRALDEAQGFQARAQRLVDLVVPSLADEAWLQQPEASGLPPTLAAAQPAPISSARAATAQLAIATGEPQLAAREPAGGGGGPATSSVALPLRARGGVLGALTLARHADDPGFTRDDVPFLRELADRAGLALENARLYEQQRSVAHTLQHSLLAGAPPADPRFAVAAHYQPGVRTLEVGGDWHDTFRISEDRIALVVGDVVGRGIDAATAMGQLRSAIRALAGADPDPARLLDQLDRFAARIDAAQHATVAYAEVALDSGRMRFACAGHPPPLLGPPAGEPRLLWDGRSAPLGAYPGAAERAEAEVTLEPGARVLLYTDGLVERRGRSIDAGLDRLVAAFARRRDAALPALVGDLPELLLDGAHNDDDVCLLAFMYAPAPAAR